MPNSRRRAMISVILWSLCVSAAALVGFAISAVLPIWTPDGRLAVQPWVFTIYRHFTILVAGAMYIWFSTVTYRSKPGD